MDTFKKLLPWMAVLTLSLIVLSGCTKKNNLTGNNFSDVQAQTISDSEGITMGFSYPADTLRTISGSEVKLLAGNYNNATAISYMRFTGLPRRSTFDMVDSCYVTLKLLKRSTEPRTPLRLQLYKIMRTWNDTLSVFTEADLQPLITSEIEVPADLSLIGEEVKIPLSYESVFGYETGADSTGWNLAVKAVNSGWVELASAETIYGPNLSFKYKTTDATTYSAYKMEAVKDSYTFSAPEAVESEAWKISNISPTRLFIKFIPNYSLFRNTDGSPLNAVDLKRLTINKATLVLHTKENPYYSGTSTFSLFPFNVTRDSVNDLTSLVKSDYEILLYTITNNGLVYDDSLMVDITPLIQAYTSGDRQPKGIVIQSLQERQNFAELEFWDCFAGTPGDKKPYIRVTYTAPYLKQ